LLQHWLVTWNKSFHNTQKKLAEFATAMEIALREALGSDMPAPSRKQSKKSRKRKNKRRRQDDILSRTLHA